MMTGREDVDNKKDLSYMSKKLCTMSSTKLNELKTITILSGSDVKQVNHEFLLSN